MKKLFLGLILAAAFVSSAFSAEKKSFTKSFAEDWTKELSVNLSYPMLGSNLDVDVSYSSSDEDTQKSLDSIPISPMSIGSRTKGVGALFAGHFYRKDTNLALLAQGGVSKASDETFDGTSFNLSIGVGKRIKIGEKLGIDDNKITFIPSAVVGFHRTSLEYSYSYPTSSQKTETIDIDYEASGTGFDIGGNLYVSYLLSKKAGVCASLDLMYSPLGFGFLPAAGGFIRL